MATIDTIPRLAGTRVYWRAQLLDALDLLARRRESLLPTRATSRTASGLLGNTFARPIAGLLSSGEQP